MIKEVIASGKLSVKDLSSFLFYHNYSRIGGKLTGAMGVVGFILAPIFFLQKDMLTGVVFAIMALMYGVFTPLDFYSKAKRQLRTNPVFKNKMTFVLTDTVLRTTMYTGASELEWDDIIKIIVRKDYYYIYIKEDHALVVPKRNFACVDDIQIFEEFIDDKGLDIHVKKRLEVVEDVRDDI